MKRISREEAESVFRKWPLVSSRIEKDSGGLSILFTLENENACLVRYDTAARTKSYFLTCGGC